jgi:predicted metal-dependent phosphoesterase TrpH
VGGDPAESGRIRVDMHLHTARSFDCLCDPVAVLEAAAARGVHRICVTDHNEIDAALDLADRYPARVIVGEEVKTAEGVDVIGLFLRERIPAGTPALATCERIHAQDGRILAVIEKHVDIVEGFNARIHSPALNRRAVDWAAARGLPLGAGSDAHTLGEVAAAYVELPSFELRADAFLAALRRGTLHGRLSGRAVHLASTYAKLRKRFR